MNSRSAWLRVIAVLSLLASPVAVRAQAVESTPPAFGSAYVDDAGVIRWEGTREEVRLFGANYTLPSASDYRAAGYLTQDRKRLIDQDLAHFARMGWDGLRVAFWGDYQSADLAGNLIENDHLDLLHYLIAKARERGIYILFNPIHAHNAGWPDALGESFPGFGAHIPKSELGRSEQAIAAQVNYLRQILEQVNPYTGTALKDEPAILLIEMINEPWHHPEDLAGSVNYINALVDAVRSTGSRAILFHNVSQDFRIAEVIRNSKVQGASYGWYPTGLNAGRELQGNYLRSVDEYPGMHLPELATTPRVVYEFDAADLLSGYMYPAMARTFRTGGVQFAAMFAYDMLATASRNLGWQTHYLNLVYTPRTAMSAVIAAEVMRRLPRGETYGAYPLNTTFGPFRVSYEENLSEMVTPEAFLHAGSTRTMPPEPAQLQRLAGYGSSPVVAYSGEGSYFLDRVREGVWRLEVFPDAVPVDDPFKLPSPDKVVTRAIYRAWPMRIELADLGSSFSVEPITAGNAGTVRASGGEFVVRPGVYVLSARGPVDRASLPASLGPLRFDEYHVPEPDLLPLVVQPLAAAQFLAGRPVELSARVVDAAAPDSVALWIRAAGRAFLRPVPMQPAPGYEYSATLPADLLGPGLYEYVITVSAGDSTWTFPERAPKRPSDWDYRPEQVWRMMIVEEGAPLRLLAPGEDFARLSFTRIADSARRGLFRVVASAASGEPALRLELPVDASGRSPEDFTASLVIEERVRARGEQIGAATALRLRLRGSGPRQVLHLTLMEQDGTSWSTAVVADSAWAEITLPLAELRAARGVHLPMGFPGTWNYWVGPAAGRGGAGDAIRIAEIERLQLSLHNKEGTALAPGHYGIELESITLLFE